MSGSLRARVKIARPNQSQNYIDTVKTKDLTKTIQYFFNQSSIRIMYCFVLNAIDKLYNMQTFFLN